MTVQTPQAAFIVVEQRRIDYATVDAFCAQLQRANAGGALPIIVDISRVETIASIGLRMLLETAKKSKAFFALVAPQPPVREVLEIARLDGLIPIFESRDAVSAHA